MDYNNAYCTNYQGLKMSYVNITEAAKLAGISRNYLYVKYIKTGKITVTRRNDVPMIDTAEILRVFGELKTDDSNLVDNSIREITEKNTIEYIELREKLARIEAENRQLQERLDDKERHLQDLREVVKLLEHQQPQTTKKKRFWFF
jgi:predicted nuclease with TOPRIM domain